MKRIITLLFILIASFTLVASKIAFIENNGIILLEVGEISSNKVVAVQEIFEKFPKVKLNNNQKNFVPQGILNAYYFVDTALIIDLNSKNIQNYSSEEEIFLLLQILYSLFENINGIDRIYILVDGKQSEIFIRSVNIYFSFPKDLYKIEKGD
ncbi:GerMN domain-containing protein [Thermosipho globiformans]|uniref:GerMN domain-containing protein n=1 Tax=Thermosipho globiformans TaxID=380685 RepID=UPI000F8CAEBC|nr:GerMN domain-containing protein [Thermosipho globiformans]